MKKLHCSLMVIGSLLAANSLAADTDALHFHVVKKQGDEQHVSNIPRAGYTANGKIIGRYHPNSIVYQQRELIKRLTAEQRELDRQAELEYRESIRQQQEEQQDSGNMLQRLFSKPNRDIIRRSSKKGLLEDLIELEKLGGRAEPLEP